MKKDTKLLIRLTTEEKERFQVNANEFNVTLSQWVRLALHAYARKERDRQTDVDDTFTPEITNKAPRPGVKQTSTITCTLCDGRASKGCPRCGGTGTLLRSA